MLCDVNSYYWTWDIYIHTIIYRFIDINNYLTFFASATSLFNANCMRNIDEYRYMCTMIINEVTNNIKK